MKETITKIGYSVLISGKSKKFFAYDDCGKCCTERFRDAVEYARELDEHFKTPKKSKVVKVEVSWSMRVIPRGKK